jgi:hypothetical protein
MEIKDYEEIICDIDILSLQREIKQLENELIVSRWKNNLIEKHSLSSGDALQKKKQGGDGFQSNLSMPTCSERTPLFASSSLPFPLNELEFVEFNEEGKIIAYRTKPLRLMGYRRKQE